MRTAGYLSLQSISISLLSVRPQTSTIQTQPQPKPTHPVYPKATRQHEKAACLPTLSRPLRSVSQPFGLHSSPIPSASFSDSPASIALAAKVQDTCPGATTFHFFSPKA